MRVLIDRENRPIIEERRIREMESVPANADTLIFFTKMALQSEDVKELETRLSEKIGKKCVVLDWYIEKVIGV